MSTDNNNTDLTRPADETVAEGRRAFLRTSAWIAALGAVPTIITLSPNEAQAGGSFGGSGGNRPCRGRRRRRGEC